MNVLVLGGSNSLLNGSYLEAALQILGKNTSETISVDNFSVGGTSSITAISRIFDLPPDRSYDLIIYEYALNDAGHLGSLKAGAEVQSVLIRLVLDLLTQRFPDALLVPVIFAVKTYFSPNTRHPIHEAQSRIWTAAQIPHLDMRQRLAYLFANAPPEWLYSDTAHYSRPYGVDLIAPQFGRFLVEQWLAKPRGTLRAMNARMQVAVGPAPFSVTAMSADQLAQHATGSWERVTRSNRVMSVPALRLHEGAALNLPSRPLNLAVLSDRKHDVAELRRRAPDQVSAWNLSARFMDVDSESANPPDKDRFFYTGIPLPLVLDRDDPLGLDPVGYELRVPDKIDYALLLMTFDSFNPQPPRVEERRVDLVSALFLTPATRA